jgi:hypothetical protein
MSSLMSALLGHRQIIIIINNKYYPEIIMALFRSQRAISLLVVWWKNGLLHLYSMNISVFPQLV